jgi:hypothetical protein
MRTKVLLGLAVLAAGAATSMAQSNVYSLNIVGYANVPIRAGYNFHTTPFRVTTAQTNGANEILPANTGQYDGDAILTWSGHGWASANLDSSSPSGFSDSGGTPIAAPILSAGKGYLYYNGQGASNNITYVGEVRTGTNTVSIPGSPEFAAVGSPAPLSGGVISVLQFSNPAGVLDGDAVLIAVGAISGFSSSGFDSASPTGFSDSGGTPIPAPSLAVGQGFFFDNLNAAPVTWTQVVNP